MLLNHSVLVYLFTVFIVATVFLSFCVIGEIEERAKVSDSSFFFGHSYIIKYCKNVLLILFTLLCVTLSRILFNITPQSVYVSFSATCIFSLVCIIMIACAINITMFEPETDDFDYSALVFMTLLCAVVPPMAFLV